jgi:hypothetical protein
LWWLAAVASIWPTLHAEDRRKIKWTHLKLLVRIGDEQVRREIAHEIAGAERTPATRAVEARVREVTAREVGPRRGRPPGPSHAASIRRLVAQLDGAQRLVGARAAPIDDVSRPLDAPPPDDDDDPSDDPAPPPNPGR